MSLLIPNRILPDAGGTLLLSGKKSLLCYGLFYKLPKQDFRLLHQCQIQLVDEQLQIWIALYHQLKYLTFGRRKEKEVCNVQSLTALFFSRCPF